MTRLTANAEGIFHGDRSGSACRSFGGALVSLHQPVRPAPRLLGDGETDRRAWIENRLEELGGIFAIAVGGFAIVENQSIW